MALYHVTGLYTIPGDKCSCVHCPGHTLTRQLSETLPADNEREALYLARVGLDDVMWQEPPIAKPANLRQIEQYELERWNNHEPLTSPFALATARGER